MSLLWALVQDDLFVLTPNIKYSIPQASGESSGHRGPFDQTILDNSNE